MSSLTFSLSYNELLNLNERGKIPERIDSRMLPFLDFSKWKLYENYQGEIIKIPDDYRSSFHVAKYFQVVKREGDPLFRQDERDNEISFTLWAGWKNFDHECEINFFIAGKNVLSGANVVGAEIIKTGGAKMVLTYNGKIVTDFAESPLVRMLNPKAEKRFVWIPDMTIFN